MTKIALISAIVGLALASSWSFAIPTDFSNELAKSDVLAAKEYAKQLVELDEQLMKKLPDNADPMDNVNAVAKLLKRVNAISENSKSKAYRLIASLKGDAYQCNPETFRTFAMALIAVETMEGGEQSKAGSRVRAIFDHFHTERAFYCGITVEDVHRENLAHVDQESLHRVEAAFKGVGLSDILDSADKEFAATERRTLAQINLDSLVDERPLPSATRKIVSNLIDEIKESGKVTESSASNIIDEYLFRPCTEYERVFGDDLNSLRVDALAWKKHDEFMQHRQDLFQAVINSRLCKLALRRPSKMWGAINEIWQTEVAQS